MLFENLSLSNTFTQWVATTQKVVPFVNEITTQGLANVVYSNTNISISGNVAVGGNTTIGGLFILDEVDFDELDVAGNLKVDGAISTANAEFLNLNVVSNVATVNTTSDLKVGQNAFLYGDLDTDTLYSSNLVVGGNFIIDNTNVTVSNIISNEVQINDDVVFANNLSFNELTVDVANFNNIVTDSLVVTQNAGSVNVTNELHVGTNATVYGNLNVSQDTTLTNFNAQYINIETANVYNLIGDANTQIYNTIQATTAAVSVAANVSEFTAFAVALG